MSVMDPTKSVFADIVVKQVNLSCCAFQSPAVLFLTRDTALVFLQCI